MTSSVRPSSGAGRALSEKAAVFPVCTAHGAACPESRYPPSHPYSWLDDMPISVANRVGTGLHSRYTVAPLHNTSQLEPFLVFDPSSFQNDSQAALSTHQWACFPWLYPLLIRGRVKNGDFLYHRYWETSSRPEIMAQAGNLPDTVSSTLLVSVPSPALDCFAVWGRLSCANRTVSSGPYLNTDLMFWGLVGPKPEPRWKWLQKNNGYALVPQLKI
ncbi:hypothetical protein B0H14DRAFT_2606186 [Mycena olivaceomarginata]|nr:hypothetical protein B0H14DRAFT_2606186 [Mycena olivaceomarginata]